MKPIRTIRRIKRIIISAAVISIFAGGIHIQKPAIQNYTANRIYDAVCDKLSDDKKTDNKYVMDIVKKISNKDRNQIINIVSKYVEFKNIPQIMKHVHSEKNYNEMLEFLNRSDRNKIFKILHKYLKEIPDADKKK